MAEKYQTIEYRDELLADKSVSRVYTNNRREWRTLTAEGSVAWRDSSGASGTDELLGDGIIKRSMTGGQTIYGREQGYGRTLWSNGFLTVNRTSFGGRIGTALAAIGGAALIGGGLIAPPLALSAQEEEHLRQQQRAAQQSSTSSDSGGDSSWDDGGDMGDADGDFG